MSQKHSNRSFHEEELRRWFHDQGMPPLDPAFQFDRQRWGQETRYQRRRISTGFRYWWISMAATVLLGLVGAGYMIHVEHLQSLARSPQTVSRGAREHGWPAALWPPLQWVKPRTRLAIAAPNRFLPPGSAWASHATATASEYTIEIWTAHHMLPVNSTFLDQVRSTRIPVLTIGSERTAPLPGMGAPGRLDPLIQHNPEWASMAPVVGLPTGLGEGIQGFRYQAGTKTTLNWSHNSWTFQVSGGSMAAQYQIARSLVQSANHWPSFTGLVAIRLNSNQVPIVGIDWWTHGQVFWLWLQQPQSTNVSMAYSLLKSWKKF
jgi:hypothetical protein